MAMSTEGIQFVHNDEKDPRKGVYNLERYHTLRLPSVTFTVELNVPIYRISWNTPRPYCLVQCY